jgi:hypothetical protein
LLPRSRRTEVDDENNTIASEATGHRWCSKIVISSNEPIDRSSRAKSRATRKGEDGSASERTDQFSNKSPSARSRPTPRELQGPPARNAEPQCTRSEKRSPAERHFQAPLFEGAFFSEKSLNNIILNSYVHKRFVVGRGSARCRGTARGPSQHVARPTQFRGDKALVMGQSTRCPRHRTEPRPTTSRG